MVPPTLLIRMSIRPNRSLAFAMTAAQSSCCSRSAISDTVWAPSDVSFSLTSCTISERSTRATVRSFSSRPGRHRLAETLRRAGDDQDLVREPIGKDHVSGVLPDFSMPARMVAFACSLWSTMIARRASISSRSYAATMSM